MSVFCGLPHEAVQADSMYAPYARLVISTALRSLYRPRPNLADGENDFGRFRKWYAQFYSEEGAQS